MMKKQFYFFKVVMLISALLAMGCFYKVNAQASNIKNDVFWYTVDGQPINSQGGGIFRFADPLSGEIKYYWYGVHYREADTYRNDPSVTLKNATFESVTCYISKDLVKWSFVGDVLTKAELMKHGGDKTWVGRLGVAFINELKEYVMVVQHGSQVLFAVSKTPGGQFTWHQEISMKEMIGTTNTGDQTVFTDEENGKSYLIYSYGRGRNKIYVSEIGVKDGMINLLDCTKVFEGKSREGNCMFKYKRRYYMVASNIYGWDASFAYYLVADNIRGPYLPTNEMLVMDGCADDYAHVTQTGFFVTVKGSKTETVVFCGDRWADFAGNGLGYNHWFPLSFDGSTPHFNSVSSWDLDTKSGQWNVARGNNYVKNGSFEADRRNVPNPVKPMQLQLTGWVSTVLEGNTISLDSSSSPSLNHNNSETDRKVVIGEKSLCISDQCSFKRKTSQLITSSPAVNLENGKYTLTAKVMNSSGFGKLEIYASSNEKIFNYIINKENKKWETIKINNIWIANGKVEIGFLAEGAGGSFCYADDITLLKQN